MFFSSQNVSLFLEHTQLQTRQHSLTSRLFDSLFLSVDGKVIVAQTKQQPVFALFSITTVFMWFELESTIVQ